MSRERDTGITLGGLLAVVLSWSTNHSIAWCILHFILGWIYVIYWAVREVTR